MALSRLRAGFDSPVRKYFLLSFIFMRIGAARIDGRCSIRCWDKLILQMSGWWSIFQGKPAFSRNIRRRKGGTLLRGLDTMGRMILTGSLLLPVAITCVICLASPSYFLHAFRACKSSSCLRTCENIVWSLYASLLGNLESCFRLRLADNQIKQTHLRKSWIRARNSKYKASELWSEYVRIYVVM